jgi:hypothetical protein
LDYYFWVDDPAGLSPKAAQEMVAKQGYRLTRTANDTTIFIEPF